LARTLGFSGVGALAGAAGGYMSLVAMMLGLLAAAIVGIFLLTRVQSHRSAAGGGFLFGLGLTVAWLLVPALTNRDPAVTYDPSTIAVLIVGLGVALVGLVLVFAAVGRELRRRPHR
jgi:FtsH-binding integral membrane protein